MNDLPIYLDNAATTFPKPDSVSFAVLSALERGGGNPGRGSHKMSLRAAEKVFSVREKIAASFGCDAPENVIFVKNCTEGINLCVNSLVKSRAHVIISDIEHNAVLRPVHGARRRGVEYSIYGSLSQDPAKQIEKLIRKNTSAVILCHRSNVLPIEQPIYAIADLCKRYNLTLIIDAAQSAGSAEIDISRLGRCAICSAGHKGLYGPSGTGFVIFSKEIDPESAEEYMLGGSGSMSALLTMPKALPERFEAGTLNTVGIAGLGAGIDFVRSLGTGYINEYEKELSSYCKKMLSDIRHIHIYMEDECINGTVLFNISGIDCDEVSAFLDQKGICVRSGLHCAYLAHRISQTQNVGAVRISFGIYNTKKDSEMLYKALRELSVNHPHPFRR